MTNEASVIERKGPGRPPKNKKRVPVGVRLTPELRDALAAMAEQYGRSLTQQVELLLEGAVRRELAWLPIMRQWANRSTPPSDDLLARLDRLEAALAAVHADQTALQEEFATVGAAVRAAAETNWRAAAVDELPEPAVFPESRRHRSKR